ncbi:MAG: hypothetical protein EA409_06415 [Saprospirales bacterium]|nr:MAG: hypothetical protein EA409_06415 [Saprospirales bacterium]
MRVISGRFKGRRFHPPADKWPTRPTTDFAREGLFNILENRLFFDEINCLDLFGGTGSHSLELISRGCKNVTYVDMHLPCIKFIEKLRDEWGIADELEVIRMDVEQFLLLGNRGPYDYIFAGPPYPLPWLDKIPDRLFSSGLLADEGLFVLEHNPNHDFSDHSQFSVVRNYGKTLFSFFQ